MAARRSIGFVCSRLNGPTLPDINTYACRFMDYRSVVSQSRASSSATVTAITPSPTMGAPACGMPALSDRSAYIAAAEAHLSESATRYAALHPMAGLSVEARGAV